MDSLHGLLTDIQSDILLSHFLWTFKLTIMDSYCILISTASESCMYSTHLSPLHPFASTFIMVHGHYFLFLPSLVSSLLRFTFLDSGTPGACFGRCADGLAFSTFSFTLIRSLSLRMHGLLKTSENGSLDNRN